MNKSGPIIIIEDDVDDQELLSEVIKSLHYRNEIIFFSDGQKAFDYFNMTMDIEPFIIISDINMPKLNGFELRDKVKNNKVLSVNFVPFLFFTTSDSEQAILKAYSNSVQGFFVKSNSFQKLQNTIRNIVEYWQECCSPQNLPQPVNPFLSVVA